MNNYKISMFEIAMNSIRFKVESLAVKICRPGNILSATQTLNFKRETLN
jgi:hypothetical protein